MTLQLPTRRPESMRAHMMTPAQLRAARALVGWSREDLAKKSDVGANTIKDFEINGSDPRLGTVQRWRRALGAAGVEFIEPGTASPDGGAGVRLREIGRKK